MWIESNHDCWRVLFCLTFDAEDWDDDRTETTKQRRKISLEVKVAGLRTCGYSYAVMGRCTGNCTDRYTKWEGRKLDGDLYNSQKKDLESYKIT